MGSVAFSSDPSISSRRSNILFIAVDDLKPATGSYGHNLIKTPEMDRLAAKGTIFMHNYCQQAVSGPSRASLMTGKRPDYTKVWDLQTRMRDVNPDILAIPQYFAQQGYTTAGIGKIYDYRCVDKDTDKPSWTIPYYTIPANYYHNNQPAMLGYYQNPATRSLAIKYQEEARARGLEGSEAREYVMKYVRPSVECMDLPDNAYNDGAMTDRAIEILDSLAVESQPFFLAVGFARPHLPFAAPKKYWDLYRRDEIPLADFREHAENSPEIAYHSSGELRTYSDIPPLVSFTDIKNNHIRLPDEKQKELIHGYYASVSYVDAQVGKLLGALDSLNLTANTIIVLWGDHGWHLGDHGLWCKHTNYEQAVRSPLLISAPGIKPGRTKSVTEFVDIFPTLCELSGIEIPENLDGKSLASIMKNPRSSAKNFAVSQYPRGDKMGYSIRTRRYRLTWWMGSGFRSGMPFSDDLVYETELYDYKKDPDETVNLTKNKRYRSVTAKMNKKITAFFNEQAAAN